MIKLKEMRKKRGLTQAQLAAKVRHADPTADQTTISVLERGELYPSEKLRDALCAALDCTEAELYDGVEAMFVPADEKEVSETTFVIQAIFAGHSKYIPRHELRQALTWELGREITDRTMRRMIETARQDGMIIANDQDGYGYYLPTEKAELIALYNQNQSRALAILKQQKHIRREINAWEEL